MLSVFSFTFLFFCKFDLFYCSVQHCISLQSFGGDKAPVQENQVIRIEK